MKDRLAKKLLAKVMGWGATELSEERASLQAMARYKYDSYQQFAPGMRFIASLAQWLNQLDEKDRSVAYEFIRNRLIFISEAEMEHLVSIAYPDYVKQVLVEKAASKSDIPKHYVSKVLSSREFRLLRRQSLFLGLSDGARIDRFRRINSKSLSHEQIYQTYQMKEDRVNDMKYELREDISRIDGASMTDDEHSFKNLFLIDDFSGSGLSYLRKEEGVYKGKISRVLRDVYEGEYDEWNLVEPKKLDIFVVLYTATSMAHRNITKNMSDWFDDKSIEPSFEVITIQRIRDSFKVSEGSDEEFINLLKKYTDESVLDEHYKKGKHDDYYFGFNECALPLVLGHNTPNNSVLLLWIGEDNGSSEFEGLFPRVDRHKTE
jgi:hypothetical protein